MAAPPSAGGKPIESRAELVEWFEKGRKPVEEWRVGTEHEKFAFNLDDLTRVAYEGSDGRGGIRDLLEGLAGLDCWERVEEHGNVIALSGCEKNAGCSITLEPGGQLELSGSPLKTIHQTCREVNLHLDHVREVDQDLGVGMLGLGFDPKSRREDVPWMPKGRYKIMREYMPKKGSRGLDMMLRTCTVQANLDFGDERDMVRKMRAGIALQPVATALFANSPFLEGKPSGFQSLRSNVWTDTDPDRTGVLPIVFDEGFGFEMYVDYVLDVPMYFIHRDGEYLDVSGQSFRDFLDGRLPGREGEAPLITDFGDHVTTVFTEVRLKRYLEMRGADGGNWQRLCALPALWVGLLYDEDCLQASLDLVRDWTVEDHEALRLETPRLGLAAKARGRLLSEIAVEVLEIARQGLTRRGHKDAWGETEAHFLAPLDEIARSGVSPAVEKLEAFEKRWNGSVEPLYKEFAY